MIPLRPVSDLEELSTSAAVCDRRPGLQNRYLCHRPKAADPMSNAWSEQLDNLSSHIRVGHLRNQLLHTRHLVGHRSITDREAASRDRANDERGRRATSRPSCFTTGWDRIALHGICVLGAAGSRLATGAALQLAESRCGLLT